jgi:pancreatic triacylglycerol lipase
MKSVLILAAVVAGCLAHPGTLLHFSQITEELRNTTNYILFEREDGLFEVEDLHNPKAESPALFATEDDITFYFFTPQNRVTGVQIKERQLHDIVRLTGFNVQIETLIIIHGWRSNGESAVNDLIKTAALQTRNINVIVIDWSPIASKGYTVAQGSVVAVGNYIGDFLLRLDNELNHRLNRVTISGHSLGAHISGVAGARTRGVINTIVGLDPAGPLFSESNINNRLDPTDASHVHVIHTNDGLLGFNLKMGHADYYPNGGKSQSGCGLDIAGTCAHSRAYEYFAESLNNNNFRSRLCGSWANYQNNQCNNNQIGLLGGFPVQRPANGNYYLATNSRSPFAQG